VVECKGVQKGISVGSKMKIRIMELQTLITYCMP